jgi:hypothetical protein
LTRPLRGAGIAGAAAAASTALAVFAIFRVAIERNGANVLGCWALMQGLFVIARVADSGAGVNLARRFAILNSDHRKVRPWQLLGQGAVLSSVPVGLIAVASYVPIVSYIDSHYAGELPPGLAVDLGIWCVLSGVIMSLATLVMALCDGAGRIVERNVGVIVANCISVLVMLVAEGFVGPRSIGVAYTSAAVVQLVWSLSILAQHSRGASAPPRANLVVMLRENLQLNVLGLTRLSFEPTTKYLISVVAPLHIVAAVDLAMKMTSQVRVVIQAAVQPLLVLGSRHAGIAGAHQTRLQFQETHRGLLLLSGLGAILLCAVAPFLSWIAYGSVSTPFLLSFTILAVANMINAAGLAGYMYGLSAGGYGALTKVQFAMATITVGGGLIGSVLFGQWTLCVLAYGIAFCFGGLASMSFWTRVMGTSVSREVLGGPLGPLLLAAFAIALVAVWSAIADASTSWLIAISLVTTSGLALLSSRSAVRVVRRTL